MSLALHCHGSTLAPATVRVAVVVGKLDRGGTERHLLQVLPPLREFAIAPEVFALHGGGVLAPAMRGAGVPVIEGTRRRGLPGLVAASLALAGFFRRARPDVIHFFLPEAYLLGALCSVVRPRARRVMSRRSLNHYQRRYPGIRAIERSLHARMHAVLGNSRAVIDELLAEGAPRTRLGLLHNGIATAEWLAADERGAVRARLGIPAEALVGVTVANLIHYKGHRDLVAALASVRECLPDGWLWLCVGRDDGLGRELCAVASQAGLAEHLRWVGEQAGVRDYLVAADLAVLPSHEEGFSNAVLEAMAAALPLIASAVGGNSDAILDGATGLLVPPRDPSALGRAILALARDPPRRHALGLAARERVASVFTLERCIACYADLYHGLLAGVSDPIPASARLDTAEGASSNA